MGKNWVELCASAYFDNGPSARPWKEMDAETKQDCCADMVVALRKLQEILFEQFDGHAYEPSQALAILIARYQAAVDE